MCHIKFHRLNRYGRYKFLHRSTSAILGLPTSRRAQREMVDIPIISFHDCLFHISSNVNWPHTQFLSAGQASIKMALLIVQYSVCIHCCSIQLSKWLDPKWFKTNINWQICGIGSTPTAHTVRITRVHQHAFFQFSIFFLTLIVSERARGAETEIMIEVNRLFMQLKSEIANINDIELIILLLRSVL